MRDDWPRDDPVVVNSGCALLRTTDQGTPQTVELSEWIAGDGGWGVRGSRAAVLLRCGMAE